MEKRSATGLGFALCALALSGCATSSDMDALRNNVTSLQIESNSQKRDISQIKTDVAELSRDVSSLREYSLSAMKESQSSLISQTSDISRELQALKGRFDEYKYFMDKTSRDLLAEKEVQQARIAALEKELRELKGGAPAAEKPAVERKEQPTAPEAAPAAPDRSAEAQKLYDSAQADIKDGKYAEARKKLDSFLRDYPHHPLAPSAQFLTGEAYYGEKRYEDAILSYEALLKKSPENEKARAAMLKQAYSFIELGDRKTGKVILERIVEKYPRTREAELAEKKLSDLSPRKKKP